HQLALLQVLEELSHCRNSVIAGTQSLPDPFILVIPGRSAGANPDKFVWNEFEQPKVGPKGKVHGRTL
ncbi:MAG TPA: hypothetical protein VFE77_09685, partial [Rhodanobacter sp.]|nr:hypothetical protein [Rhodanobacter sp.]